MAKNSISRRDFLSRTSAVAAAAVLGPTIRAEAAPPVVPAIDTHTHFYDPSRPEGVPWPGERDALLYRPHFPEQFQSVAEKHGVAGTVVVEASPWVEDNQWVLDLAADNPVIVGFVGNLPVGSAEFSTHLRRFSADPLFRGLRLGEGAVAGGLGQRPFENDLQRLAEQQLTLDLLGGAAMLPDVVRLARVVPHLPLVVNHLPFETWDGHPEAARRALAEVAQMPHVYAKVSGVARRSDGRVVEDPAFYEPGLDVLWEQFGADRLLFGSNWPVSERVAPYEAVHRFVADYFYGKGRAAAEKFFWRNALAVYRWQPRGAAADLVR